MNFRLVIIFLILLNTGCSMDCNYDVEVENVKSLSEKQLKEIFEFVEQYSFTLEHDYSNVSIDGESFSIPHINYLVGGISKNRTYLKLGGCYDDKAIINIRGYGDLSIEKSPAIILFWGDGPSIKEIELWNGK